MSWARCGYDSKGRPIGYAWKALCDAAHCQAQIDRGLSYACGGMHGETTYGCENYFCENHLNVYETPEGDCISLCDQCYLDAPEEGEDYDD